MERLPRIKQKINNIYFDTKLFVPYEDLQTYIIEQSRLKNVDPVAFVCHLLPVVSHLMSGLKTEIVFHDEWREPTILFHMLVASKSSSKTPVMNLIFKPVTEIEQEERENAKRAHDAEEEDDEGNGTTFNTLAHIRVFDGATGPGMLHALNAGTGNMIGMIDEMSNWSGLTDPALSNNLLKAFSAMPWGSLTVQHKSVVVAKPYINIAGNIQTEIIHELLQKKDPQAQNCRYSLYAVRDKYCKTFNLEEQMKALPESIKGFSLKEVYQEIIQFHESQKVEYHFTTESLVTAKEVISSLNAMADASKDEDFESICSKSVSKFLRTCGVQTALRNALEDGPIEGIRRRDKVIVKMLEEDVVRAKRCVLYTLASYTALKDNQDKQENEVEEGFEVAPGDESIVSDQPCLPKARKYRRKSAELPDPEMSTMKDLVETKIANQLAKWYRMVDENDEVSVSQIRRHKMFVRSKDVADEEMMMKLIELVVFHGVMQRSDNQMIKIIRTSQSSVIQSKIDIMKNTIPGYLD